MGRDVLWGALAAFPGQCPEERYMSCGLPELNPGPLGREANGLTTQLRTGTNFAYLKTVCVIYLLTVSRGEELSIPHARTSYAKNIPNRIQTHFTKCAECRTICQQGWKVVKNSDAVTRVEVLTVHH